MRWLLLAVVVVTTVVGDLLQSLEMRTQASPQGSAPNLRRVLTLAFRRRYLILSILAMAISFFAFLALVQTEPISFAVPASAASFILETILARILLRERISLRRGIGTLLVFGGILMISK